MQFRSFTAKLISPIRYSILWAVFLGCVLFTPGSMPHVFAQSTSEYALVDKEVTTRDRASTLELNVLFYVIDAKKAPITLPRVEAAEIQIGNDPNAARVTTVQAPRKPLYLVLLLDTSGSMSDALDDMLAAVSDAVGAAPENAQIALSEFSSTIVSVRDFTENRGLIQRALDNFDAPNGGTCLYDAVYAATAQVAAKDGRRTVIVFTDGRDEKSIQDPSPCSRHTLQEIINQAVAQKTVIHTIGLDRSGSIDAGALREMSASTGGVARTGSQTGLRTLFQEAISGLDNEYLATTNVVVDKGEHPATLRVRLSNGDLVTKAFVFQSLKNYVPTPLPPTATPEPSPIPATPTPGSIGVQLKITSLSDHYNLHINLSNSALIHKLLIQVEESGGMSLPDQVADVRARDILTATIPYSLLNEAQKYRVRLTAYDANGEKVRILDEEKTLNSDKPAYLLAAEKEFVHVRPTPAPNLARIEAIRFDMQQQRVIADLFVNEPGKIEMYNAYIINEETGEKFYETGLEVFAANSQQIQVPMPAFFLTAGLGEMSMLLAIELFDEDRNQIDPEPYKFVHRFPPRPGRVQRLRTTLSENLWLLGAILVIVFVIIGWLIGKRNKRGRSPFVAPTDYTVVQGAPDLSDQPHLTVQVIQTPSAAERKAYVITEFPCTIGRSSSCQLVFSGDTKMSRKHAQITLRNDAFYLTDLGSNNGTSIDGSPLSANSAAKLRDAQNVTFGRDTSIDIKIQYQ